MPPTAPTALPISAAGGRFIPLRLRRSALGLAVAGWLAALGGVAQAQLIDGARAFIAKHSAAR